MWQYKLADLRPVDDPETWAQALADDGWTLWPTSVSSHGSQVTINGRTVRRYSLRRWVGAEPPGPLDLGEEPPE